MTDIDQFRKEVRLWLEDNCPLAMRQPIVSDGIVWGSAKLVFQNSDQQLWFERMRERG